ncbi:MAG: prepilin-type N-terminal cleavage/methylation domain-containing protein [Clostridia bacterium]|nr:MAG: prepilin-type N-terminal cleavage/methylation domain-containing protein [Clostridia bacterium]
MAGGRAGHLWLLSRWGRYLAAGSGRSSPCLLRCRRPGRLEGRPKVAPVLKLSGSQQGDKAFTLAEVIIAVMLLALVMAAAYQAFSAVDTSWRRGEDRIDAQQNLRIAADRIAREVRQSGTVTVPVVGNSGSEIQIRYSSNRSQPQEGGGSITYNKVRFYLSNGQILRGVKLLAAEPDPYPSANWLGNNVVAYGVQSVTFSQPAKGLVVIGLTTESSGGNSYTVETTVRLRASE